MSDSCRSTELVNSVMNEKRNERGIGRIKCRQFNWGTGNMCYNSHNFTCYDKVSHYILYMTETLSSTLAKQGIEMSLTKHLRNVDGLLYKSIKNTFLLAEIHFNILVRSFI